MMFWILLFKILTFDAAAAATDESVVVKPQVRVASEVVLGKKDKVFLSDIAVVQNPETNLLKVISEILISDSASTVGTPIEIESTELVPKLREKLLGYQLSIPSKLKLLMSDEILSRAEIERKITNQLSLLCGACEFSISSLQLPPVKSADVVVDYSKLGVRGSFMLPLTESTSTSAQLKWVTGQVRIFKSVPAVLHTVVQGQRIQPEDVHIAKMDITNLKDQDLTLDEVIGQQALHSLNPNSPLARADLKREPVVRRGQLVKALLGSDEFEITTNVSAEENGFIGDVIKVKNLETNKMMTGTVTDKSMVKIQ